MTDSAPVASLPGLSSAQLLVAQRSDLLVAVNQFCVWPEGVRFTVSVRVYSATDETPEIQFSQFNILEPDDVTFTMDLVVDGIDEGIGSFASQTGEIHGLFPAGLSGSFGPNHPGAWDVNWWLSPLPAKSIAFRFSCGQLGLATTESVVDATDFAALASQAVGFRQ